MRGNGKGALLTSGFFVCVFAAMILAARDYPERAALVPYVVAIPGLLLSLAQFAVDLRWAFGHAAAGEGNSGDASGTFWTPQRKAEFAMVGWLLAILAIILLLGFWVGIALYLPLYLRLQGREPWKLTLVVSAGGWVGLYVIFQVLLRVPLFEGFLFNLMS
jgi:hypothetical protein